MSRHVLSTLGFFLWGTLKHTQRHFFDILKDFWKTWVTAGYEHYGIRRWTLHFSAQAFNLLQWEGGLGEGWCPVFPERSLADDGKRS